MMMMANMIPINLRQAPESACNFLQTQLRRFSSVTSTTSSNATTPTIETRKRVTFASSTDSSPPNPLAFEELQQFWYSKEEIYKFGTEVQEIVRFCREHQTELPRGLEACTEDRLRHRWLSVQCIRSAVSRGVSPENVAMISQQCAAWSNELAFVQACHDFAHSHEPQLLLSLPKVSEIKGIFPFAMKRSRDTNHTNVTGGGRRVRRRTN